ncbi:MAG: mandelate racemase/muconate lactonizing enzyme family protein [Cyclobacteriaceae bacterium]|nr:mandelate racemase/muconate lactonizing enzyme family protein [Cyclobacteriaceae bacterium]
MGLATTGSALVATPLTALSDAGTKQSGSEDQSGIKITDVKTYKLYRAILIKVETNAGIAGWGESSPNSTEVIESFVHNTLKSHIIGQDPFNVELIWDTLFWQNHDLGPSGALPYAIAGIDLALWDIKGKVLKQPVYKLLGGSYRKETPAYGGFGVYGGSVSVEKATEKALKLAEKGFKFIKLRMQIREYNMDPIPDFTVKYYEAVRKALPADVELFVDPNEGYTAARAIQIGLELQSIGMKYYESPCPLENHRDLAEVVKAINIPVLAGEKCYTRWQFRDLILEANPDVIQPDLIKAGGITEVKKIAALAQAFFKTIAPHNTKPTLGTAAAMHLMASISNVGPFIEFIETEIYEEVMSVFDNQVEFKNGKLHVPEGVGLGLNINEKRLEKLAK